MKRQILILFLCLCGMAYSLHAQTYPPSSVITMPYNNAYFKASTDVEIHVYASDIGKTTNNGTVTKVEFYNGTTLLGEATTHNNYTYKFVWKCVPAGTHTLKARATNNRGVTFTSVGVVITVGTSNVTHRGMSACKGKYLANIISNTALINYNTYWNGVTAENSCKWGSVEGVRNTFNWGGADVSYNHAKNNNMIFRYHAALWAAQYPSWLTTLSTADARAELVQYMAAIAGRYPLTDQIDVLNEQLGNHQADNQIFRNLFGGGTNISPTNFGWQIWLFEQARALFPNTKLILNDYGLENDPNAISMQLELLKALRDRGLVDGFGTQAHCFNIDGMSASNLKSSLDRMAGAGIPIYVTELDLNGGQSSDNNAAAQLSSYQTHFPVYWDHPAVSGITLWGYVTGATWIGGTGLISSSGAEKSAMTWLKNYVSGKTNTGYPMCATGACTTVGTPPTVSLTAPANNASFNVGANITLTANASDADGSVTKVEFFNGTTKLGEDAASPYSYTWTNVAAGTYSLTAVATDNAGNKTTSAAATIQVIIPQGPYNNSIHLIPGTIQTEAFDVGGNGFAYLDNTPGSAVSPLVNFRTNEDVDIENCTDAGGGYNIGYATAGEWLEYTVNVQTTGIYDLDLRVACQGDGRTLTVGMDGTNIATNVAILNTTGWQVWQTVRVSNISLTAGQKIMRLTIGATDYVNLNYLTFSLSSPPAANITAGGPTTFCSGGSVLLNASTGTGYTYQWKKDGSNISNATSSSYTATQSGNHTVTVSANSQTATSTAIVVTVNATPGVPSVNPQVTYCQNAAASQLSATGTGLKWYTVSSGGTSSSTAPTPSTSTPGTMNYYVSQTTNGCESPRAMIAVTVNAHPVITPYVQLNEGAWIQQNTAQLCAGGSVILGPQPVSATGWSWTGPSGFTSASREVLFTTISSAQGGVYTVSYTSNGCTSTQTFNITVNNPPNAPMVNSPASYCQNATASQLLATGTGLKWYTVSSGGTSSFTAPTPSTNTAGTMNYYVSQTVNGCESSRTTIAVTVNATPGVPTVTSPVTHCQNTTTSQLSATGTGLKWYTVSSGGTSSFTAPTPSTNTAGTMNYYVSQTVNGCESSRATIAVTVNAIPGAPAVTSPVTYCQNATASQLSATGSEMKWYSASSGGTSSSITPTPSTTTAGTTNHYVSQTVNGCEGPRAIISITINALPDAAITASGPTTFVQGGSVTLNANTGSGLSYTWFNGTTQIGTGASYTATSTGSYAVEVNNAFGCKATSSATNVSANGNQPSIISIVSPTSNSSLNGPITISVTASDPDGGITLVEYLDGANVIGTSTASPYSFIWDNPSAGDHVITVRVTDSNGGITTSSPITVTSTVSTGIQSSKEIYGLVYPNPSNGEMNIETEIDLTNAGVTVINVLGEELELSSIANGKGARIDVSNLVEGTYLLIIRQDNAILKKKITVIK